MTANPLGHHDLVAHHPEKAGVFIGLSNWSTARVAEAQAAARANPALLRPVCHSPNFSLFEMGPVTIHSGGEQVTHAEMMDPGFQPGVRLMTYSPLGGFSIIRRGWEAARQDALALKQAKERYWGHVHDAVFTAANAARYRHAEAFLRRFNARHGTAYTLDQLVDAYALAHPRSEFVVIGPRTLEQLRRTVASLALARLLTRADLDALHGAGEGQGRAAGKAAPSRWPAPRRAAVGRASGGGAYN